MTNSEMRRPPSPAKFGGNGFDSNQMRDEFSNGNPSAFGSCWNFVLAREFVLSLRWSNAIFDSSFDKCYCDGCYSPECPDVERAGGSQYIIPRGWVRFGVQIDPTLVRVHDVWCKWIVTFHGTTLSAAESILAHRQFCLPGDTLLDGTKLAIRDEHIKGENSIFTSPTIAYCSSSTYSRCYSFTSKLTKAVYEVNVVLQCRQKPGTFTIQSETIDAGRRQLCRYVSNDEIEYFTTNRSTIMAYGLLVRLKNVNE